MGTQSFRVRIQFNAKLSRLVPVREGALLFLVFLLALSMPNRLAGADSAGLLWQIGKPDNDDREFALAPNGYSQFREDGFFVVGKSDPKRDWPYVHPGPADGWAGERQHTFSIVFGVKEAVARGMCKLQVVLLDTHSRTPPELSLIVNGMVLRQTANRETFRMPPGAGDASVFGEPTKGKPYHFEVEFPARQLRAGANEISLTTLSGSWILYDCLSLEAPPSVQLAEVSGTVVGSITSPAVLVDRNGKLMQTVKVAIRHCGGLTEARLRVGGASPLAVKLTQGAAHFEVAVPAVAAPKEVSVTVEVGGKTLATKTVTVKPVRKWVVYLLPHSHVDIGYTHVQTDVEKAQWKYLEMAMDAARKSVGNPPGSRFKWNVEVLWAVDSYLKQATPEKRQQFIDAVKAGQVGLQALYGNELTGLCRPEELLRLVGCAQQIGKLCDTPVTSAMITDVPGYTWGIVPAFAHSGVKYFSIGPNGGDRIGHTIAAWGDKPFWWIGPNGQDKVLVWMTGTGYYRVFSSDDNLLQYLGSLEEKNYPYDFVQVRHCLGDNGAPDVNFADTVKQWNDTHAYPKLVIATTDDMFRDFEARYGDKLPTAQGDFTPYWEDGAASSALETAMNRASADRLTQAETLFAMFNPKAYPAEDFYQAWRNVLLYDEHTWGAHNSISQPDAPFVKSQWAIKRQFAVEANSQSRKLLAAADTARGDAIPPAPSGEAGRGEGATRPKIQAIDVFNTTSQGYPYALVTVPKELSTAGDGIAYSPTNRSSGVSQRLTTGELVFRPCVGSYHAHRWYITDDPPTELGESFPAAKVQGVTLTSSNSAVARGLTLRLDEKTGGIASLVYEGRELVDTNSPTGLNDYFYLPGSDLKGLLRNSAVKISVKEKGPLIASLVVESEAPGCRQLTREYRLHALRNYLEIINTVDKLAVRAKEGVHFGFGFNVPGGTVRLDVAWGVVRPEEDQIPGACKNWFTVQRFVDISNNNFGVTWLTPDAPLVEVGGITANLIGSLSDPRAWRNKIEPSTTIYSWAMNNHWHTNYRAEQDGPTVFRYCIIPHGSQTPDQAARVALEMGQPLLVLPARGEQPKPPPLGTVSGAQVSSFKPSTDGKAWIVRLFNPTAKAESAKLSWTKPEPKAVWLSDNSEQPLEPFSGTAKMPAWGILTLRAELPE
jgi:alpha-mannosidase